MNESRRAYRPLVSRQRFGTYGRRAWLADDHLLIAARRLFSESYSRLYWADIQSALLYSLERPTGFLLAIEWVAILSAPIAAIYLIVVEGVRLAAPSLISLILFIASYAAWRFTRPRWCCQVVTATSVERFPLAGSKQAAQVVFDLIIHKISDSQGGLHNVDGPVHRVRSLPPHRPVLVVHWLIFCYGLLSWILLLFQSPAMTPLFALIGILDALALLAAYFAQRRFDFPFAARSAAVAKMLLTIASVLSSYGLMLLGGRALPLSTHNNQLIFSLISVAISLYGVFALFLYSSERSDSRLGIGRDALKIT